MENFPPLESWFKVRQIASAEHRYERFDFCLQDGLKDGEEESLTDEIALLIARLRLRPREYQVWLGCWMDSRPIPREWKARFRHRFWKSFVSQSATDDADGEIVFDEGALQGYLGELMLYIVQDQLFGDKILDVEPPKPKFYSKSDGIDCLEIIGCAPHDGSELEPSYFIVWEAKGLTTTDMGNQPSKIYSQHLSATPKSFGEIVDALAHRHESDAMGTFIDRMIDSFYARPPSPDKSFGACVTYSNRRFARSDAFSGFVHRFRGHLAGEPKCRQVRICSVGNLKRIADEVREKIWRKLLL
jgi:hypothetical protein